MIAEKTYDLLIIGGGINGTGIANDAAGRGLSVALCEQYDFAYGTSWKSSKLIHGGLRYLELGEFNLVRKALKEREILLRKAPHIIHPLTFVLPYYKQLRPAWMIRLGLFLYDYLSKRRLLAKSKRLKLKPSADNPLQKDYPIAFSYADCYVDDARLVVLNALQAQQKGATILAGWQLQSATRTTTHWQATLRNTHDQSTQIIKTRVLINAAGPWGEQVLGLLHTPTQQQLALVKGSHIVVPKLYDGDQAYILQQPDKRVVFVIPFQQEFSLIGTTDIPFLGDLKDLRIDQDEIYYLCAAVNRYFQRTISSHDVCWSYAGVRPLKKDEAKNPSAITRDFSFEINAQDNLAPLLMVFGGKLTTYRELAEEALQLLKPYFPHMGKPWTATEPLPGGDIPQADFQTFYRKFAMQYPWLPADIALHYAHNYGTLAHKLLENCRQLGDLGEFFAAGLYQREVEYLIANEWAFTAEDILWRRTKLGLHFSQAESEKLNAFIRSKQSK